MSYFAGPTAEYKAKRIAQMLHPANAIAAQRDGRVLCNTNGHVHLFDLNELGQLIRIDHVDMVRIPEGKPVITVG